MRDTYMYTQESWHSSEYSVVSNVMVAPITITGWTQAPYKHLRPYCILKVDHSFLPPNIRFNTPMGIWAFLRMLTPKMLHQWEGGCVYTCNMDFTKYKSGEERMKLCDRCCVSILTHLMIMHYTCTMYYTFQESWNMCTLHNQPATL